MHCRFEDRVTGRARVLQGLRERIEVRDAAGLPAALDAIERARRAGHWVALLLDYELGEWLAPETTLAPPTGGPATREETDGASRLTALVFDRMVIEAPWSAGQPSSASGRGDLSAKHSLPTAGYISAITPRMARSDYLRHIATIRELIAAGELYQVNFTLPLDVQIQGDARLVYQRIAARHPVAHAAYIEDGDRKVLSFSPELFVRREGSQLTVRPMKGTAPRHSDPAEDTRLCQTLVASVKNRSENLMIVDLLRNDLGRLARPGSVRVPALFTLEAYPTVWTMTSTVTADVPDATFGQILQALFPCGSITGAPKVAAMRRIRQMEIAPRGLYCGAIGWLAPDGDFSLNVAIRTLVVDASGHGVYSVGGGIVYDSDPEQEWQECLWKARILRDGMNADGSGAMADLERANGPL
ncbi:aminodeoxychorismate synthase component I [Bordetella sp. 15P40C-2]|uniref:aminodeoxychorismate synthase component I n=1 Tax=Bordetella sp. 15P40C-2 TaxID=2572246 RepID=UPI00132166A9|nr:aminodeoxychorismate synthase component I [Bordetella sp. 15P40C-2]MVW70083.1 aminodeoxychorismate synthase component I [Bordetella sp. 15P40C-2]